jgi:hypothetical protein
VYATTTDLAQDLQHRLKTVGLTPGMAAAVTELLPPAGQHDMCTELRDNPDAVQELGCLHRDALAERWRTDSITADEIRGQLRAVA